jgi:hypothetical protein
MSNVQFIQFIKKQSNAIGVLDTSSNNFLVSHVDSLLQISFHNCNNSFVCFFTCSLYYNATF